MTRKLALVAGTLVMTLLALVPPVSAQTASPGDWQHGTTLDGFAGAGMAASADTRGALGGAVGWEVNHRLSIEGAGMWLVARQADDGFAAELKALVNVTPPNRVVPFLGAGIGLYRASFDAAQGPLPEFYQRRLTGSPLSARPTFTDPSFVLETGVDVFMGSHVSIRPDLSVRIITRDSETYAVTLAALHLTYHFEVHDFTR